jgi:hypothetical protein
VVRSPHSGEAVTTGRTGREYELLLDEYSQLGKAMLIYEVVGRSSFSAIVLLGIILELTGLHAWIFGLLTVVYGTAWFLRAWIAHYRQKAISRYIAEMIYASEPDWGRLFIREYHLRYEEEKGRLVTRLSTIEPAIWTVLALGTIL